MKKSFIIKAFDKELVAYAFCDFKFNENEGIISEIVKDWMKRIPEIFWFHDKSGIIFA